MAQRKKKAATPRRPWRQMVKLPDDNDTVVERRREHMLGAVELNIWVNDRFIVIQRINASGTEWLSIKHLSKSAVHDWRLFQQIKNDVCGSEREAMELYPAQSRLVDTANQYHLWVLPEGERFGVGFKEGLVFDAGEAEERGLPGVKQRKMS
jgi:hypothetical protein